MIARMPMAGAKTTSLTSIDVPSRARLSLTLFLTLLFHLLCSTEAPGKHLRLATELHTVVYPIKWFHGKTHVEVLFEELFNLY